MSLKHLDKLFRPQSIALIGASNRPGSIGAVVMNNLLQAGFSGPISPVKLSQLILDIPEISGLGIHPLLADQSGVLVLNAQAEIIPTRTSGPARLAIRPYPKDLEEWAVTDSGLQVLLRPIRPEDEPNHLKFFNKLSEEDRRMRFFGYIHEISHSQLAKFTQIDYNREMAFIATNAGHDEPEQTLGVVRAFFHPDNLEAEFAVVVRTDLKLKGLGTILMDKMIRYSQQRKTQALVAYTLRENRAMQALAKKFGASIQKMADDPDTVELKIPLSS